MLIDLPHLWHPHLKKGQAENIVSSYSSDISTLKLLGYRFAKNIDWCRQTLKKPSNIPSEYNCFVTIVLCIEEKKFFHKNIISITVIFVQLKIYQVHQVRQLTHF